MVEHILQKQRTNSELITKLISNFETYSRRLDEKSKVNHIFHDFDEHLRKDLNSLVKLSNERYKSVKSGNKVIKIINKQKDRLNALVSSVANDDLYKSEDIYEEKKKLNQPPIKNNEINNIRLKLRDIQPVQGLNPFKQQYGHSNKDNYDHPIKSDNEYINMLTYEKKSVQSTIQSYVNFLNDLKINSNLREELYKKKFNLFPENLQFLNFKEMQSHSVEKKTVQNELIDMQKLLNLAKSKKKAKQTYYENKKKQSKNRSKSFEIEPKRNVNDSFASNSKKDQTHLFENTMIPQNNPISIIKNGIAKSYNIEDNLKDKNENITNSLGEIRLPQIDEYQKLIAKVLNAKKLIQMTDGTLNKNEKTFQEKVKDKRRFKNEDNPNNNFLSEIKKIKRKPINYIDDYSKRESINDRLNDLNKYITERNIDKTKLNRKIDEYLLVQERKLAEEKQIRKKNFEKDIKTKNKVADDFKRKFINNLHDPSFRLEEEDNSTRDLDLFEKSSIERVIISPSQENILANYNDFKNFQANIEDKEKDKSYTTINYETEKKKEIEIKPEFTYKNSPKFQNFSNFIYNNNYSKIINRIKDTRCFDKNTNIFEKSMQNLNIELPVIVNKNKKVEEFRGKNLMYNLNLNTNSNDSIELYDKI